MAAIKGIFTKEDSLRSATWILVVTLLLSNILGFIRDRFLAQKIPTDLLDTYYAAFRLPDLVFNLLILGAIASAFIPVFSGFLVKKKEEEAFYVANAVLNFALVSLIFALCLLFVLMPFLVSLLVPAFSPEKQILTVKLARILLFSPLFFSISYILGGVLNSFRRFLAYALAPLFYNLSIILATFFWADRLLVYAPVWGVVLGAFLHLAIQVVPAWKLGFRWRFFLDLKHAAVRKIGLLMLPRSLSLGAQQISLFVFTALASGLGGGAVAIYNLADNIQTVPTVIIGNSIASSLFPTLSHLAAGSSRSKEFGGLLMKGLRSVLFIVVPAAMGMVLLRAEIVRLILGSGHFGWEQTLKTSSALGFFAVSLAFSGSLPLLARAFFALKDTKTPAVWLVGGAAISILLSLIFVPIFNVSGLALAFSFGAAISAFGLFSTLKKRTVLPGLEQFYYFVLKVIFAALIMAVFIQLAKLVSAPLLGELEKFWKVLLRFTWATVVGLVSYYWTVRLFKIKEATGLEFWKVLRGRFWPVNGSR